MDWFKSDSWVFRYTQLTSLGWKQEHFTVVVIWQYVRPCVLQPRHDKTLGGWAWGTKGEQCQANSSSAGVHSQRQTMETTTGCLPGGGREIAQTGEGWGTEMLACFPVWLIHSNQIGVAIWNGWCEEMRGMSFGMRESKEEVVWKWKLDWGGSGSGICCANLFPWILNLDLHIVFLGDGARVPEQSNPSDQIPEDWTQPNHRGTGDYAKG